MSPTALAHPPDLLEALYLERDMGAPLLHSLGGGTAAVYTSGSPDDESSNQDGALVMALDEVRGVLAVADGVGGQAAGERAAAAALRAIRKELRDEERALRERILSGFEKGNERVSDLRLGAATTLAVAEIGPEGVRTYHAGDSGILLVGQRGRRKFESISHSPVGYAVEAGVLNEAEAMHHQERHVVSNMLGSETMHISMSHSLKMAPRDTLLLASDGLLDNLNPEEVIAIIRKGPLQTAARALLETVAERMRRRSQGQPSKPDDLTFILFRRNA